MAGELLVEFLDDRRLLVADSSITFGRAAELVIDENPFLHRVVGRVSHRDGLWWLQNHCRRARLELEDHVGTTVSLVAGGQFPLGSGVTWIRFSGGASNYELSCEVLGERRVEPAEIVCSSTATVDFGVVPLTELQHLLLVALCAPRLGGQDGLPPSQVAARALGWSITKFNRQLDHVCTKFRRAGVRGLCGDTSSRALDRRVVLVDHALATGLVTPGDLGLLGCHT